MSKKRLRHCPALGKEITSADCGENRHSRYPCPADCEHNPFAPENYDGLAELEDRFEEKLMRRVYDDPLASGRIEDLIMGTRKRDELSFGPRLQWQLHHRKDKDGASLIERWERDGYAGLRNDERTLAKALQRERAVLLEVLEVKDDRRAVAVDLLRPEEGRLLIIDRGFASIACRFDRFVSFTYPLPHYHRMRGGIFHLPETGDVAPAEVLETLATHLGGSLEQEWIYLNTGRLHEAATAVSRERMRRSMLSTDLIVAEADYHLKGNWKTALGRLVAEGWLTDEPNEEEEDEGFQMALLIPDARTRPGGQGQGQAFNGAALLKPGHARLSVSSRAGLEEARAGFERILGKQAEFQTERVQDVAKQAALASEPADADLVPPRLVEVEKGLATLSSRVPVAEGGVEATSAAFMRSYYEGLLDEAIPQLGGLTPRQAAADEAARPKALEWVKGIVRGIDQQNLETGRQEDANWLVRELGLQELDFPPPPPGRTPAEPLAEEDDLFDDELDDGFEEEEWLEDEDDEEDGDLLPFSAGRRASRDAMELPDGLAEDQERMDFFSQRMDKRLKDFPTAGSALDAMDGSGCFLIDELFDATAGLVDEETFDCSIVPLLLAWLALVPPGKSAALKPGAARRELEATADAIQRLLDEKGEFANTGAELLRRCREPELLLLLWEQLFQAIEALPRKRRPEKEDFFSLMMAMVAAVNVLVQTMEE